MKMKISNFLKTHIFSILLSVKKGLKTCNFRWPSPLGNYTRYNFDQQTDAMETKVEQEKS